MRESRPYGSVRGALSDERPYRVRFFAAMHESGSGTFELCRLPQRMSVYRGRPEVDCARSKTKRLTH